MVKIAAVLCYSILILILMADLCHAEGCVKLPQSCQPENKADINSVDGILEQLHKQTQKLNSYQCRIEYLFNQPLFESQT